MKYTNDAESDNRTLYIPPQASAPEKSHVMSSDLEKRPSTSASRLQMTDVQPSGTKNVQEGSPPVEDHKSNCNTSDSRCKADTNSDSNSEQHLEVNESHLSQIPIKKNSLDRKLGTLSSDVKLERFTSLERSHRPFRENKGKDILVGNRSVVNRSERTPEREEDKQASKKDEDGSPRSRPRSSISLVWRKVCDKRKESSIKESSPIQTSETERSDSARERRICPPMSTGRRESPCQSPGRIISPCQSPERRTNPCQSPSRKSYCQTPKGIIISCQSQEITMSPPPPDGDILPMDTNQDIENTRSFGLSSQREIFPCQPQEKDISQLGRHEREISPLRTPEREGSLMFSPERDMSPIQSRWRRDSQQSSERSPEQDKSTRRTSRRGSSLRKSSDGSQTRDRSPVCWRTRGRGRGSPRSPRRSERSNSRSWSRNRRRKHSYRRSQSFQNDRVASWSSTSNRDSSESDSTSRERYLNCRSNLDLTSRERFLKKRARHELKCYSQTKLNPRRHSPYNTRPQVRSDSSRDQVESRNVFLRNRSTSNLKTEFRSCVRRANQLLEWSNNSGQNGLTHQTTATQADTFPESVKWNDILSRARKSFKNNSTSQETFLHQPSSLNIDSFYRLHNPAVVPKLPPPNQEFVDLCRTEQIRSCCLSAERLQCLEITSRQAMHPLTYLEWFLAALRRLIPHKDQRMNREDFNDIHDIMDAISKIWGDLAEYTVFNSAAFLQLRREAYLNQTKLLSPPEKELLLRETPLTSTTLFNSATRDVNKKR